MNSTFDKLKGRVKRAGASSLFLFTSVIMIIGFLMIRGRRAQRCAPRPKEDSVPDAEVAFPSTRSLRRQRPCGHKIARMINRALNKFQSRVERIGTLGMLLCSCMIIVLVYFPVNVTVKILDPIDHVIPTVLILILSTLSFHYLAFKTPTKSEFAQKCWRTVDYPWVLTSFVALFISILRVDHDIDRRAVDADMLTAIRTGNEVKAYCDDIRQRRPIERVPEPSGRLVPVGPIADCAAILTYQIRATIYSEPEHTARIDVTESIGDAISHPIFSESAFTDYAKIELDRKLVACEVFRYPETSRAEYIRILTKMNDMTSSGVPFDRLLVPRPIRSHGTLAYFLESEELSEGSLFEARKAKFCMAVNRALTDIRATRPYEQFVFASFFSSLPAWYFTLAVLAGLRLGRTAYETRR